MEKELLNSDKELLLKELCARLPYGIKVKTSFDEIDEPIELKSINIKNGTFSVCDEYRTISGIPFDVYECKPYLFPMSSMTDEQYKECFELEHSGDMEHLSIPLFDWCNKNHFDYRNLIEKGLAIDATGLNIY